MTSYSHEIISDDTRLRLHFAVIKDSRFTLPCTGMDIWKLFIH